MEQKLLSAAAAIAALRDEETTTILVLSTTERVLARFLVAGGRYFGITLCHFGGEALDCGSGRSTTPFRPSLGWGRKADGRTVGLPFLPVSCWRVVGSLSVSVRTDDAACKGVPAEVGLRGCDAQLLIAWGYGNRPHP